MKKITLVSYFTIAFFGLSSFRCFAAKNIAAAEEPTFWQSLGDNVWIIVIVLLFGAGLIIINKWSTKIKQSDEKFRQEYEEWKSENPEKAMKLEEGDYFPPEAENGSAGEDVESSADPEDVPKEQCDTDIPDDHNDNI